MKARKLELKTLKTRNERDFVYRDVLELLINTPEGGQGIQIAEMRTLIKLLDKLDASNGSIHLTIEEWEKLKTKANRFQWGMVSKEIISFVDDLEGASEVELTEHAK